MMHRILQPILCAALVTAGALPAPKLPKAPIKEINIVLDGKVVAWTGKAPKEPDWFETDSPEALEARLADSGGKAKPFGWENPWTPNPRQAPSIELAEILGR